MFNKMLFRLAVEWAKLNGREYRLFYGRLQVRERGKDWEWVKGHMYSEHKKVIG